MRAKQEKGTSIATAASVASPATANTKKKSRRQPIPSLVDPEDIYSKRPMPRRPGGSTKRGRISSHRMRDIAACRPSSLEVNPAEDRRYRRRQRRQLVAEYGNVIGISKSRDSPSVSVDC